MGLHNKSGPPLNQLAPQPSAHLQGLQGDGWELWLEKPDHPLPGQPRPPKAPGVDQVSLATQHQDCPSEVQFWWRRGQHQQGLVGGETVRRNPCRSRLRPRQDPRSIEQGTGGGNSDFFVFLSPRWDWSLPTTASLSPTSTCTWSTWIGSRTAGSTSPPFAWLTQCFPGWLIRLRHGKRRVM